MSVPVVTVDGTAGSGKSTLGRRLALALGLPFIDTGLFYRAVTAAAVKAGLDEADVGEIARLAAHLSIEVNTDPSDDSWHVRIDGADPGSEIRDPRHTALLTAIGRMSNVRLLLLPLQRAPAAGGGVAVGRDCGTVVFPDAAVKLYLDAAASLRAARRAAQLESQGSAIDADTLHSSIVRRDQVDAPALAAAPGAVIIDTGLHGIDEMVDLALSHCAAAGLGAPGRPG